MFEVAKSLKEQAQEALRQKLSQGEEAEMVSVPMPFAPDTIYVSTDPEKIVAIDSLEYEGKLYYLGHKRSENNKD